MAVENENLPSKTLLKPAEVAVYFGVSRKTVYRWCARGQLRGVRLRRSLRIYRQSVLETVAEGREEEIGSYEKWDEEKP